MKGEMIQLLPPELDDLIEDLIAPGFRERLLRAFVVAPHCSERLH